MNTDPKHWLAGRHWKHFHLIFKGTHSLRSDITHTDNNLHILRTERGLGNLPTDCAPAAADQVTAGMENIGGITYCGDGMLGPPLPGYAILLTARHFFGGRAAPGNVSLEGRE
jgi:hypothetical protein